MLPHLHLCDINPDVVDAWQHAFQDLPNVTFSMGDIFTQTTDAIVSPANSFGFMDGGIDLIYRQYFGRALEARLQQQICQKHFGELPVGQAIVIETQHPAIPWLICAPTMRIPSPIQQTVNVYLAFRAALIAAIQHPDPITSILVPGLGTGVGHVTAHHAARQMRIAYDAVQSAYENPIQGLNAMSILRTHHQLMRIGK